MIGSVGKNARVFIEIDDAVYDMTGLVSSISVSNDYDTYCTLDMSIIGTGVWMNSDNARKTVRDTVSAIEWQCSYCGRANKRADTECASCGGIRSFIYG